MILSIKNEWREYQLAVDKREASETPAIDIWKYYSITPEKLVYHVGEELCFYSHRWALYTFEIDYKETFYCEDGTDYRVKYDIIDANFVQGEKGQDKDSKWCFGSKEGFKIRKPGADCHVISCQNMEHEGEPKRQCYTSEKFNVIP